MKKYTLIYDNSCPFCYTLAHWFRDNYKIKIVSNQRVSAKKFGLPKWMLGDVKKDVHLIEDINDPTAGIWKHGKRVFHGADAAARLLSIRYPFVWTLYSFKPAGLCFKLSYFALKKIRKYLYLVL